MKKKIALNSSKSRNMNTTIILLYYFSKSSGKRRLFAYDAKRNKGAMLIPVGYGLSTCISPVMRSRREGDATAA